MHLPYGRTVLLGLAFLGVQTLFGIYNAYVPIFLQSGRPDFRDAGAATGGFGLGAALTGLITTFDNLAAILILPSIGALSDATSSRMASASHISCSVPRSRLRRSQPFRYIGGCAASAPKR